MKSSSIVFVAAVLLLSSSFVPSHAISSSPRLAVQSIIHATQQLIQLHFSSLSSSTTSSPLSSFSTLHLSSSSPLLSSLPSTSSTLASALSKLLEQLNEFTLTDTPISRPAPSSSSSSSSASSPPSASCYACEYAVSLLVADLRQNSTIDLVEFAAVDYCIQHKIYGGFPEVCAGMVRELGPEVMYVITQKFLQPTAVCSFLGLCASSSASLSLDQLSQGLSDKDKEQIQAAVHIPAKKSERTLKTALPLLTSPSFALPDDVGFFYQFSDIHYDALYTPGTMNLCGEPLCCREHNGPGNSSAAAGIWGDYNCDTSPALLSYFVSSMQSMPQPDFVLWTGDDPPHDVWEQSREENLAAELNATVAMSKAFPNVKVFGSIGNHEAFPVDQFEGPPYDSWLYETIAQDWSQWLDSDALTSLSYAGYYTTLITPTLRLVSLNTQFCDVMNFWLILNDTDPGQQIAWLSGVLSAARSAGEKVYIIGHIPFPDGACYSAYASTVVSLIRTYSDIIVGLFHGHIHHDLTFIVRDEANVTPLNVGFACPSITTDSEINPSFRAYFYNRTTYEVLDYQQFYINITDANLFNSPSWTFAYSPLTAYNMTGLTADDYQDLLVRLQADDALFNQYYQHFSTEHVTKQCNGQCRKFYTCFLSSSTAQMVSACMNNSTHVRNERLETPC